MNYRHRLRLIGSSGAAFLIALSMLVLGPAAGAQAAGTQVARPTAPSATWSVHAANARAGLSSRTASGSVAASTYPSDCTPRSDQPHLSTTNPGYADAKGWTICRTQRPSEHVDSTLYRQDCFLFICWLTQVGYDSMTGPPSWLTYGTVRAVPNYRCNGSSSHYYEIDSNHQLTDFDGTIWYSFTSNSANVNCG